MAGSCLPLWVVHVCKQRLQQLHCCVPLGIHDFLHLLGADIQGIFLQIEEGLEGVACGFWVQLQGAGGLILA